MPLTIRDMWKNAVGRMPGVKVSAPCLRGAGNGLQSMEAASERY